MGVKGFGWSAIVALLFFVGCSAPTQKAETNLSEMPRKPDMTLQVASLNMSGINKRFDKKEIEKFSKFLKKEKIEVLSVQGITRYPELESRVDFVKELAVRSDMEHVFGETVNSSGRQTGNGIFSAYPIRNTHNDSFDGVKSAEFDAALQTSVDGGIIDILIVSTTLPAKASEADQAACIKAISDKSITGANQPAIITGNLPSSQKIRALGSYNDVYESTSTPKLKNPPTRIWYTNDSKVKLASAQTVETEFGTMLLARFEFFR
jgi:endonuclease/exonuclease/phosphatase family metal-dependent hydrolase